MTQRPTGPLPHDHLDRDPLAVIAVSAAPIVLEGRYRAGGRGARAPSSVAEEAVGRSASATAPLRSRSRCWPLVISRRPRGRSRTETRVCSWRQGCSSSAAQALKALGWARLFTPKSGQRRLRSRPATAARPSIGVVLPGRFDDAMRIAVVRRYPGCPAGVRALGLSLVMLGLIDSAALAPLAFVGRRLSRRRGRSPRRPRRGGSRRSRSRRRDRRPATPGRKPTCAALSTRSLVEPANDVVAARIRGVGARVCLLARPRESRVFLLLGTLGIGYSFPLALLFLCAGAAAAALPIGPAGAATQVGAGTAALIASGVGASEALAAAVSVAALGVLSGAVVVVIAIAWRTGTWLAPTRNRCAP